jgi:hypothetical protein
MSFNFKDYDRNELLVMHELDREVQIPPEQMTIFAKALSDLVAEEAENFLVKVVAHFQAEMGDSTGVGG